MPNSAGGISGDFPPEGMLLVEQFARFLREQQRQTGASRRGVIVRCIYPTVTVPVIAG